MADYKFSFSQTISNSNGKTSGSGFIGVLFGVIVSASFVAAMIGWFLQIPNVVEIMGIILQFAGISGLLLGVRKVSSRFGNESSEDTDPLLQSKNQNKG
jgi:cadmium resistance protein CadD (predicted permease)